MKDVIQSALTMPRTWEWMPMTAARVLIGIFFCISGGTKLFEYFDHSRCRPFGGPITRARPDRVEILEVWLVM